MGSGEPLEFDPGGNADQDSLEHNNRNDNRNESRQARRNRSSWGFLQLFFPFWKVNMSFPFKSAQILDNNFMTLPGN